jgi:hypothetical protein
VHVPNSQVGQVLTPTPIPLPLPRVGGPKWAQGNFVASNHPHSCERAKQSSHVKRQKWPISRSNLTYFRAHLPCHLSPHNTLYYFNMMTCAMPDNPSLYFKINCQECKNCINARYSCSTVGCVGWLVEPEALSEGVGHARAYIWSRATPGTSASLKYKVKYHSMIITIM